MTVARGTVNIKIVGDYITVFDSIADGLANAPKRARGEIHPMPDEQPNFKWRVRCHARYGMNIPFNDVIQSENPCCYLEFSWSDTDLNLDEGWPYWHQSDYSMKTNFV